jgi:C-terminal processing protease CtpA/Prc
VSIVKKETSNMKHPALTFALFTLMFGIAFDAAAQQDEAARRAAEEARIQYEAVLEEAERARVEAQSARQEAVRVAERAREASRAREDFDRQRTRERTAETAELARMRELQDEEMKRAREELSRAHRELREASREVARAHRELGTTTSIQSTIRLSGLGDRAVIGVVLGEDTPEGVELIGISPDGPAELAGIEAGDLLVSIAGTGLEGEEGRARLYEVMETAKAGDELAVVVSRDGQPLEFSVTAELREPSSWQSLVRIPENIDVEVATVPGAPRIVVERIEIPELDQEALRERMEALQDEFEAKERIFVAPGAGGHDMHKEYRFQYDFSDLAGHAFDEANIWFGLPHTHGLEFATVNEGLGAYFKTDRGVLVVQAREDNPYQLESGDVILAVGETEVATPSDLMRALRRIEPGEEIELDIKRDRRNKTLKVAMPENRLGFYNRLPPKAQAVERMRLHGK